MTDILWGMLCGSMGANDRRDATACCQQPEGFPPSAVGRGRVAEACAEALRGNRFRRLVRMYVRTITNFHGKTPLPYWDR